MEGTLLHYCIALTRERGLDQAVVEVEVSTSVFSDRVRAMEELRHRFAQTIERVTTLRVAVHLVEPLSLPRSEGKAKRVYDERTQV